MLTAAGMDRSVRLVLGDLRYTTSRFTQVLREGLTDASHVVLEGAHTAMLDALATALDRYEWSQ